MLQSTDITVGRVSLSLGGNSGHPRNPAATTAAAGFFLFTDSEGTQRPDGDLITVVQAVVAPLPAR